MECNNCLRNIQDVLSDGKTPYERRFGSYSVDSAVPVQDQNFSEDGKEFTNISRAACKAQSHSH